MIGFASNMLVTLHMDGRWITVADYGRGFPIYKHPTTKKSALLVIFSVLLAIGTVFYARVEGWTVLDALYFSVATLATVGYGDITPRTSLGKAFTIVYVLTGAGVFVSLAARLAVVAFRRGPGSESARERDR